MCDEETKSRRDKEIKLTVKEWEELARAMQWPEDLEQWDKVRKPTNLTEIGLNVRRG